MSLTDQDIKDLVLNQCWVKSWQHDYEVHLEGCPRNHYYIASCSPQCERARRLADKAGIELPDPRIYRLQARAHAAAHWRIG